MSSKRELSVLFIVQAGKKFGIGHLKRALSIATNYTKPHFLILTDLKEFSPITDLVSDISHDIHFFRDNLTQTDILVRYSFDLIVTDCDTATPSIEQLLNKQHAPVISLDNGKLGSFSEVFIAPLPSQKNKKANFQELYYTPIRNEFFQCFEDTNIQNILISLGGSDPNNHALTIVKALKETSYNITVVAGPLSNYDFSEYPNITLATNVNDLLPYITKNNLIICGPGSTLLESIAAQKYVIAIPHTLEQYQDLRAVPNLHILSPLFLTPNKIRVAIENAKICKLPLPEDFEFNKWWLTISDNIANRAATCPLCGSYEKSALSRDDKQNYFKCSVCSSIYNYKLFTDNQTIDQDTIVASNFEQNQISYKISILEQKKDSHRRIQIIKKILPTPGYNQIYKLLDIGANHGVFVQEAAHNGYQAQGVELADFARRIATDSNIVMFDSMEKLYETDPLYQVITIWNKLELLDDPLSYIKKITKYLCTGGVLAIRLPIEEEGAIKGHFQVSQKGGEIIARRAGLQMVHSTKFIDTHTKKKYLEFYSVKQGTI